MIGSLLLLGDLLLGCPGSFVGCPPLVVVIRSYLSPHAELDLKEVIFGESASNYVRIHSLWCCARQRGEYFGAKVDFFGGISENVSENPKIPENFPKIRKFSKISENCRKFPKISESFQKFSKISDFFFENIFRITAFGFLARSSFLQNEHIPRVYRGRWGWPERKACIF